VTSEGLVIRNTKFGKSRLLVLHSSTRKVLGLYLTRRGQEAGACPYLFVSVKRRQLHENTARGVFRRLVESLGIAGPNDATGTSRRVRSSCPGLRRSARAAWGRTQRKARADQPAWHPCDTASA
jgi:integrase